MKLGITRQVAETEGQLLRQSSWCNVSEGFTCCILTLAMLMTCKQG